MRVPRERVQHALETVAAASGWRLWNGRLVEPESAPNPMCRHDDEPPPVIEGGGEGEAMDQCLDAAAQTPRIAGEGIAADLDAAVTGAIAPLAVIVAEALECLAEVPYSKAARDLSMQHMRDLAQKAREVGT